MENYYEILELSFTSSSEEIKKAYRQKAIKYHPDKNFGDEYFAKKFIEIKMAFDVLSNPEKRREYDDQYRVYFQKEEPTRQENYYRKREETKQKEEEFFYNPHKSFYSDLDRAQQSSPQFAPIFNHWGENIDESADFFKLPKNIGKIISGYTTLSKNQNPATKKEKNGCILKAILISLIISAIIIFAFKIFGIVGILFTVAIPLVFSLIFASSSKKFIHTATYIGVNGFAKFTCVNDRNTFGKSYEINFNDVTDFAKVSVINKRNFNYVNTSYTFTWLSGDKVIQEINGTHESKEGNPAREATEFWLNTFAERYWTIYLMDKMEAELEKNGFLKFNLVYTKDEKYYLTHYIELGIGYIKFITNKGEVKYNFNEIKKIYTKGSNLFIEHSNYEKKFYFFESGNKNGIPLTNLTNRQFFFRAMELLLGYRFD